MAGNAKLALLMEGFTSDEDEDGAGSAPANSETPWQQEFRAYLDGADIVPSEMPLIKWWGVRIDFFCLLWLQIY